MSKRGFKILTYPNKFLHRVAQEVVDISDDLVKKVDRMWTTMYKNRGIGLAAPQVGLDMRLVVIDVGPKVSKDEGKLQNPFNKVVMINPVIKAASEELYEYEEGCLSVPGIQVCVERPEEVTVKFFDLSLKEHEITASGILAVCMQHEIDHLDGVLMIDHLPIREREMAIEEILDYKEKHRK